MAQNLQNDISDSETTILCKNGIDSSIFSAEGAIQIDSEIIYHTNTTDKEFVNCIRGYSGTTAAAHLEGAVVTAIFSAPPAPDTDPVESSDTYGGSSSHQLVAADLTLTEGAGRTKAEGGSFLAAIMGNIFGDALTKTGNYLAGLIGALSITGTKASELPTGGVLGIIMDGVTEADGAVVAVIDGSDPSAVTRATAAFKARQLNQNAGSGVDFGVDLHDTAVSGYMSNPTLPLAISKADIRMTHQVCILNGAGAPVDGTTGDNFAEIGSIYIDRTNGNAYIQTAAITSPVWKLLTRAA